MPPITDTLTMQTRPQIVRDSPRTEPDGPARVGVAPAHRPTERPIRRSQRPTVLRSLQETMLDVLRRLPTHRRTGHRQSTRWKAVAAGRRALCPTLEAVLLERLAHPDLTTTDRLAVGHAVVAWIREVFNVPTPPLADAAERYVAASGAVTTRLLTALQTREPGDLAALRDTARVAIAAAEELLLAATRETEERAEMQATARRRLGIVGSITDGAA